MRQKVLKENAVVTLLFCLRVAFFSLEYWPDNRRVFHS